ncbi:MAG TPA: LysR family transcriptional regulator [Paracoccus sp. (in: a-proteobacteria)]|uniref:LysR family transcriptional regulator n=1 Tax=Paracoccus sp. TaxID=267 RepID=UPI002D05A8A2|nr:LysR family transcriptional regulator [Paracoccus sp. (in: a-proteobacteria)]HWL59244.1 LysR family transcriptional regulator [Paracoccus sp. (in: a-proteobacteria)]
MDARQLKTLVAIAEAGSFSRAAEMVHLSVSAVSQQMQAFEYEVGVPLFDRSCRPPQLTIAGQQMVVSAKELLQSMDRAMDVVTGRRIVGTLALGAVRTSALSVLPRAIRKLNGLHPDLRIKLRIASSESLLQDVASGRLDAAMVAEHISFPAGVRWRPFRREPLFLIAPPGTTETTAEELLKNRPYVRFSSNVPLAHMIDLELARMNIRLNEVAEIDMISTIASFVAEGLGVSVVPQVAIDDCSKPLICVPFGSPQLVRQIGLVERANGTRGVVISELHGLLVQASGECGIKDMTVQPEKAAHL